MEKLKGFKIGYHSDLPATNDAAGFGALVGAFTYPDSCRITNIDFPGLEYDTSTDEPVFCDVEGLVAEDLDDLKATQMNVQGLFKKSDAFQVGLDAHFLAKDQFSIVIEHPNNTDKIWYQVKMKKNAPLGGGPNDRYKFDYSFILRELPVPN